MVIATVAIDPFAPTISFATDHGFSKSGSYVTEQSLPQEADTNNRGHGLNAKHLIGEALRSRVEGIDHELCEPGDEDTFFVADLGDVYRQHLRWKMNLPRVKPFYGMSQCYR